MRDMIIKIFSLAVVSMFMLSGCAVSSDSTSSTTSAENLSINDGDDSVEIGSSNQAEIVLNGDTAQSDNASVSVDGSVVTISSAGVYTITGTLTDGQIVVDCSKEEKVELILNGVDITCSTSAPIYVTSADKVIINLTEDTINNISDTRSTKSEDDDSPGAAIYSKDDLTIKGDGVLNVSANYNNGIATKNDLKITGGDITVTAVNNAIKGNDSVTIKGGTFNLTCDGDGIKTDNLEEEDKGYIYIEYGDFTINSQGDCIDSDNYTIILDGIFNLTSANGYTNATTHSSDNMDFGGGAMGNMGGKGGMKDFDMGDVSMPEDMENFDIGDMSMPEDMENFDMGDMSMPEDMENFDMGDMSMPEDMENFDMGDMSMPENMENFDMGDMSMPKDMENFTDNSYSNDGTSSSDDSETSAKTISSNGDLTISSGSFVLNSQDDAIHSNSNVVINGETFTINAGGDGIHADYDCTINDGIIDIQNSYEGIEGAGIYINGGNISIVASDDGMNGSDKTDSTSSSGFGGATGYIEINGGTLYVNADGDGIDSNGDMVFNGGDVIVEGPTSGADGPLDCGDNQNTITINGGTLIAGGAQQMFETPDSTSTQNSIYCLSLSAESGSCIVLVDDDNNVISSIYNTKDMQGIVFSSSEIETGKTYHIYKDATLNDDGTFASGTEVGSVEVSSTVSQIGDGNAFWGIDNKMGGGHNRTNLQ